MLKKFFRLIQRLLVLALLAGSLYVAVFLLKPLPHDLGRAGEVLEIFPLSLLAVAIPILLLFFIAWRKRNRGLVRVLAVSITTLCIAALWPMLAQRRQSIAYGGSPDLGRAILFEPNIGDYKVARTNVYTRYPGEPAIFLDAWWPPASVKKPWPVVVKIHGGEWVHGSRTDRTAWNQWLASHGYAVFEVDYRDASPIHPEQQTGDVKAALAWITERGEQMGIDTTRIALFGISTGATVALLTAYTAGQPMFPPSFERDPVSVRCVIDFFGPVDLVTWYHTAPRPRVVKPWLEKHLAGTPSARPERYRIFSPVVWVNDHSPPTLAFHGTTDKICPMQQTILLEETLVLHNRNHEFYYVPYAGHGFDADWNSVGTQLAQEKILSFLSKYNSVMSSIPTVTDTLP